MKGEDTVKNTLSTDGAMKLVLCGCGKMHVTLGSITIHFTREEFQLFAESIRRLASIVAQASLGQTSLTPQSAPSEVCH
jgi:hypothetical protein